MNTMNMTQITFSEATSRIFNGYEMVSEFKTKIGITPDTIRNYQAHLGKLFAVEDKDNPNPVEIPDGLKNIAERLNLAIEFLYMRDHVYMNDFKCAIVKSKVENLPFEQDQDGIAKPQGNKPKGDGFSYGNL